MKKLIIIIITIFSTNGIAEIYHCEYKKFDQVNKISFDRISHSHFKKCDMVKCENKKYSVVFADNNILIIGDVENQNIQEENFYLFIIDKNTNLFTAANIKFPNSKKENIFYTGKCVRK